MDHAHPRNPPGYSCTETLNAESVLIPPEGKRREIGQHDCNRTSLFQSFGSHLPYTPENDIVGPSSQVGNHQNLESWVEIFCEDRIPQETTQHPVESNKINYAPLHNSQINIQHSESQNEDDNHKEKLGSLNINVISDSLLRLLTHKISEKI
ncbi:hypothetical protein PCASD_01606 [Puccinia coronata f. sp. avenae]|uniref:Uncharacterized protein n=1 Tax=Puccinia coronata f. sp. avenae TaxID=200324 RepID=A0A2N5VIE5_9BASI|nr:hypothetical protein PCASD_01606 [Puccinia coronata f. sp. avenae]